MRRLWGDGAAPSTHAQHGVGRPVGTAEPRVCGCEGAPTLASLRRSTSCATCSSPCCAGSAACEWTRQSVPGLVSVLVLVLVRLCCVRGRSPYQCAVRRLQADARGGGDVELLIHAERDALPAVEGEGSAAKPAVGTPPLAPTVAPAPTLGRTAAPAVAVAAAEAGPLRPLLLLRRGLWAKCSRNILQRALCALATRRGAQIRQGAASRGCLVFVLHAQQVLLPWCLAIDCFLCGRGFPLIAGSVRRITVRTWCAGDYCGTPFAAAACAS